MAMGKGMVVDFSEQNEPNKSEDGKATVVDGEWMNKGSECVSCLWNGSIWTSTTLCGKAKHSNEPRAGQKRWVDKSYCRMTPALSALFQWAPIKPGAECSTCPALAQTSPQAHGFSLICFNPWVTFNIKFCHAKCMNNSGMEGPWYTDLLFFLCSTAKPLATSWSCLWGGNKDLQHFTYKSGYWQTFFDWHNFHLFFPVRSSLNNVLFLFPFLGAKGMSEEYWWCCKTYFHSVCPVASNQSSAYQDTSVTRSNGFCPSMDAYTI